MHLVPMNRVRVLHELAATKIADAEDELRPLYFAGKITSLGFIKLLGTMDRHGIVESPGFGCQHSNGGDGAPEMHMKMMKAAPVHPEAKQKRLHQIKECVDSER